MNARVLITAGRGPQECHLVVARMSEIFITEARAAGLVVRAEPSSPDRTNRSPSIVLAVRGAAAERWAGTVIGPVQWIAPSPLRPRHARRNWFVQVALLDADDVQPAASRFDARDVNFRAIRSGGPGGQRRNKVATAVRAEHTPSGRVVVASNERTLSANRAAAVARLADLIARDQQDHQRHRAEQVWVHHDRVTRGEPVRVIRAPLA